MRRSIVQLLVLALAGCGGETQTGPPQSARVAEVRVAPAVVDPIFTGDTVHLGATVIGADGELLHDVPVTWRSGDTSLATVSAAGVVTARSRGAGDGVLAVHAEAGGRAGTATLRVDGWASFRTHDLERDIVVAWATVDALGGFPDPLQLHLRCRDRVYEVYFRLPGAAAGGDLRYRMVPGTAREETWFGSSDPNDLFYPGAARTWTRELTRADSLIVEIDDSQYGPVLATFVVRGVGLHLETLMDRCGGWPSAPAWLTATIR